MMRMRSSSNSSSDRSSDRSRSSSAAAAAAFCVLRCVYKIWIPNETKLLPIPTSHRGLACFNSLPQHGGSGGAIFYEFARVRVLGFRTANCLGTWNNTGFSKQ
jgi:hypothetical protein